MLYCYASKKAGDRTTGDTEFRLVTELKKCLVYDWKQDVFRWNHDGTIVNLADLNDDIMPFSEGVELLLVKFDVDSLLAFPHTDFNDPKQSKEAERFVKKWLRMVDRNQTLGHIGFIKIIERHGGKCIMSSAHERIIESWPNYYQTNRKTKLLTGAELITMDPEELVQYTKQGKVFVKTARKNFSEYISVRDILDPISIFYQLVVDSALGIDFIISEPAAIRKLELTLPYSIVSKPNDKRQESHKGCRCINAEYRCIVIKGKLHNMSLYTDNLIHGVPQEAYIFARQVLNKMKRIEEFPQTYNFDIMQFEDGTWDVLEFHTLPALGCYLYNTLCVDLQKDPAIDSKLREICLHTDLTRLPLRVLQDLIQGKIKTTDITEWLAESDDYSLDDHAYASASNAYRKNGIAKAYMLLRMVDTGIIPGLESTDPETREATKKTVVGFLDCNGIDKTKSAPMVERWETSLQLRTDDPQQLLERVLAEEARLKNRFGGIFGLETSDAWYVKAAMDQGLLAPPTSELKLTLDKKNE